MKRVVFFLFFCISLSGRSQSLDSSSLYIRASVQKGAVLLRWAAATPLIWKQTNRCGFRLERYTVVRNKKILDTPEKKILGEGIFLPRPLEEWKDRIEENDNAAIVAQALYGEDFQLTGEDSEGLARIVNLAQELEQRFTFALYAADLDFEVACMAGWGWRDSTVHPGEYYLYRVIPANQTDSLRYGMASVYTSLDEYKPLPLPVGLTAEWSNKAVILIWNYESLVNYYNSYYIEKSTDGVHFSRLPGRPVSSLDNISGKMVYVDSLVDNHTVTYYRIRGISPFGETGPASEPVAGKGIPVLSYVPIVRKAIVNTQGTLEIEWEFDERGNDIIAGFELLRSATASGTFTAVSNIISPSERKFIWDGLKESNYLAIKAVALEGESTASHPVLVQPLDTLPPDVPHGLSGDVDTNGVVRLHWHPNTEHDLQGYFLYRAELPDEEPYRLVDQVITDTIFFDTVELITLNSNVYYYLSAVDKRYNQSSFSKRLELRKPDLIPPLSPLISDYRINNEGVTIYWIPSPDADVRYHLLYRQQKNTDNEPRLLVHFTDTLTTSYTDTACKAGKEYTYSLFAEDYSGWKSAPTPVLTVILPVSFGKGKGIERFDAIVDKQNLLIKLQWTGNLAKVKNYQIYRSENGQPLTLWRTLPGWQTEIVDENIGVGMAYSYLLRALIEGGGASGVKKLDIDLDK